MKSITTMRQIGLSICVFALLTLLSGCNSCDDYDVRIIKDYAAIGDFGYTAFSDELFVFNSLHEFDQIAKGINDRTADRIRGRFLETNFNAYTVLLVKTYSNGVLSPEQYGLETISNYDFNFPEFKSNLLSRGKKKYTLEINMWDGKGRSDEMVPAGFYLTILCSKIPDKSKISLAVTRESDSNNPLNK